MRDYEAALKQARTCANRKNCDLGGNCEYYDLDVCCQGGEKDILNDAADAIEELLAELERYRHAAFVIGETCVDESKSHISPEDAIKKIRENIYYSRHMPLPEPTKEEHNE